MEGNGENGSCLLMPTNNMVGPRTADVGWRIPSGIRAPKLVSAVTFLAASLLVVLASIFYSDSKLCNNLK
ncbi:hypothetical protein Peur_003075 [Populus x canadensis]